MLIIPPQISSIRFCFSHKKYDSPVLSGFHWRSVLSVTVALYSTSMKPQVLVLLIKHFSPLTFTL